MAIGFINVHNSEDEDVAISDLQLLTLPFSTATECLSAGNHVHLWNACFVFSRCAYHL